MDGVLGNCERLHDLGVPLGMSERGGRNRRGQGKAQGDDDELEHSRYNTADTNTADVRAHALDGLDACSSGIVVVFGACSSGIDAEEGRTGEQRSANQAELAAARSEIAELAQQNEKLR